MKDDFPKQIPVFPLSGVIYFPKTNLPLNIFERRYLDLVNDCIKKDKLMGMVQSKKDGDEVVSQTDTINNLIENLLSTEEEECESCKI